MKSISMFIWLILFLLVSFSLSFYQIKRKTSVDDYLMNYIIIIILFFSAPFCWWAISTPSIVGFINDNNQEAWIGFFGSIISGALTVFGVWWTIIDQNKKRKEDQIKRDLERKEDLFFQYKPIFQILEPSFSNGDNTYEIEFVLSNEGRGEAINIDFKITNLDYLNHSLETNGKLLYDVNTIKMLVNGTKEKVKISITPSLFAKPQDYAFLVQIKYDSPFKENNEMSFRLVAEKYELYGISYWHTYIQDYYIK